MGKRRKKKKKSNVKPNNALTKPSTKENLAPLPPRKYIAAYSSYSGPIPPPGILQRYDEICPGGANRIITQFEEQSSHRRKLENHVITHDTAKSYLGMFFGFVIALVGLAASFYLILNDKTIGGSILGGGMLLSLVSVFIKGAATRRQELEKKQIERDRS